jgi:hypothetical protein
LGKQAIISSLYVALALGLALARRPGALSAEGRKSACPTKRRAIRRVEGDELGDVLYWFTGEILERWAPEVLLAASELDYTHDKNKDTEMGDVRNWLERRVRLRKLLRDFQEEAVTTEARNGAIG